MKKKSSVRINNRPKKHLINKALRQSNIDPEELGVVVKQAIEKATVHRMYGTYIDESLILNDVKFYLYLRLSDKGLEITT